MKVNMKDPVFTAMVRVTGKLSSSYVFEDKGKARKWVDAQGRAMENKYGYLNFIIESLPGLKVGDKCNVYGDADKVFTITGLKRFDDHRWGFILDKCQVEEVAKCHTEFLKVEEF